MNLGKNLNDEFKDTLELSIHRSPDAFPHNTLSSPLWGYLNNSLWIFAGNSLASLWVRLNDYLRRSQ